MENATFAVIGLGYVGLPLANAATRAGLVGVGLDRSAAIVTGLNNGRSHVDDISDAEVAAMNAAGFRASTDEADLDGASTIVICVPTPLASDKGPDMSAVESAGRAVRDHLRTGDLVILESTTWPGATEEVLAPILEQSGLKAGTDFHLAFSPERIDPGNARFTITNTPKVVGGVTEACGQAAAAFYGQFIEEIVVARGTREAEMSKLLENTYRQVNIALVNEMAKFSHSLDIDFWDVIRCASTKPFGFQAFYPGPGVGGHCIPIDPSYLSHQVQTKLGSPVRFVELAQEINRSMPAYVVWRAGQVLNDRALAVRGSRVLLLGVTYKSGIADQRESPAIPVATTLQDQGADVSFYDPFVTEWDLPTGTLKRSDLTTGLAEADIVIHLQAHRDYSPEILLAADVDVLDTRGMIRGDRVSRL